VLPSMVEAETFSDHPRIGVHFDHVMYFIVYVCALCSSLDTAYKEVSMQVHLVTIWDPQCNSWFGVLLDSVREKTDWRCLSCLRGIPFLNHFVSSSLSFVFSPALRRKRTCEMRLDTSLLPRRALLTPPPQMCVKKVKVKCALVQALRLCTGRTAHRGSRGIALLYWPTALEGSEGSASRPGRSLPPGKTRYPLYRRLGGPQGRSKQARKISPPPGFEPWTVQPIASHYSD